jgi:hypothetical protein
MQLREAVDQLSRKSTIGRVWARNDAHVPTDKLADQMKNYDWIKE